MKQCHTCKAVGEAAWHHEAEGVWLPRTHQQHNVCCCQRDQACIRYEQAVRCPPPWRQDYLQMVREMVSRSSVGGKLQQNGASDQHADSAEARINSPAGTEARSRR